MISELNERIELVSEELSKARIMDMVDGASPSMLSELERLRLAIEKIYNEMNWDTLLSEEEMVSINNEYSACHSELSFYRDETNKLRIESDHKRDHDDTVICPNCTTSFSASGKLSRSIEELDDIRDRYISLWKKKDERFKELTALKNTCIAISNSSRAYSDIKSAFKNLPMDMLLELPDFNSLASSYFSVCNIFVKWKNRIESHIATDKLVTELDKYSRAKAALEGQEDNLHDKEKRLSSLIEQEITFQNNHMAKIKELNVFITTYRQYRPLGEQLSISKGKINDLLKKATDKALEEDYAEVIKFIHSKLSLIERTVRQREHIE
jgi:hypothetical protein